MKIQKIVIHSKDTLEMVINKVSYVHSSRILLVFADNETGLGTMLDLKRIVRACQRNHAALVIVANKLELKENAQLLGIPVFLSEKDVSRRVWRNTYSRVRKNEDKNPVVSDKKGKNILIRGHKERGLPAILPQWIRIFCIVISIAAVIGLFFCFYPGAIIKINIPEEEKSIQLDFWTNPELTTTTLSGGIPGHKILKKITLSDEAPATGKIKIPGLHSDGLVEINNRTEQIVNIPEKAIVITSTTPIVRFELLEAVTLIPDDHETTLVPVRSVLPGSEGNVAANSIQQFEGNYGLVATVTNPEEFVNGTDHVSPSPLSADYWNLKGRLLKKMEQLALEEINQSLSFDQILLRDSLRIAKMIEETRNPEEGFPGDHLSLKMTMEFEAWYIERSDLISLGNTIMDVNIQPGYNSVPESLVILLVDEPYMTSDGDVRLKVDITRKEEQKWQDDLLLKIPGRGVDEAREILSSFYELEKPIEIEMYPKWWTKMPVMTSRIAVEINE